MKHSVLLLVAGALFLVSCEKEYEISKYDIYGTWVHDLAHPKSAISIYENGSFSYNDIISNYTYTKDTLKLLFENQESATFKIMEGSNMMSFVDKNHSPFSTDLPNPYFKKEGNYSGTISNGRWDSELHYYNFTLEIDNTRYNTLSFVFSGDSLDLYILERGWHLKGSYIHKNGILYYNISKAYYPESIDGNDDRDWKNNVIKPQTLKLAEGYKWSPVSSRELASESERISSFTFIIDTDSTAYTHWRGQTTIVNRIK